MEARASRQSRPPPSRRRRPVRPHATRTVRFDLSMAGGCDPRPFVFASRPPGSSMLPMPACSLTICVSRSPPSPRAGADALVSGERPRSPFLATPPSRRPHWLIDKCAGICHDDLGRSSASPARQTQDRAGSRCAREGARMRPTCGACAGLCSRPHAGTQRAQALMRHSPFVVICSRSSLGATARAAAFASLGAFLVASSRSADASTRAR